MKKKSSFLIPPFKYIGHSLLDLVFPRNDLLTDQPLEYHSEKGIYCGDASMKKLYLIKSPFCSVCGYPVFGEAERVTACQQCQHFEPVFEGNRSVILLNRVGKIILHELKYHNGLYLKHDIELIISRSTHIADWVAESVLVPVPLFSRKERERGYNQSQFLAEIFAMIHGDESTEVQDILIRRKDTKTQTVMDRQSRMRNVQNAFELNRKYQYVDRDKPVTIIDDVFTTGSTLNACARVLSKAGFTRIRSVTLGHG